MDNDKIDKSAQLHQAVDNWNICHTEDTFFELYRAYSSLLTTIDECSDKADIHLVLQHLPLWWSASVELGRPTHMCTLSACTKLLLEPSYMQYAKTLIGVEQPVTWLILYKSAGYTEYPMSDGDDAEELRELISSWTGIPVSDEFDPKFDNLVELLYGPACWALYGEPIPDSDVDNVLIPIINEILVNNILRVHKKSSGNNSVDPVLDFPVNLA